jgi:hypothetical protein
MSKVSIAFLVCWACAMAGLGLMNTGYMDVGQVIAYAFGAAAMTLGFYAFFMTVKARLSSSHE